MPVDEEAAKTKWCPFARTVETDIDGSTRARNRVIRLDEAANVVKDLSGDLVGTHCVGSACMAWRWHNKMAGHDVEHYLGKLGTTHTKETAVMEAARFHKGHPLRGFCGLAGRP